MNRVIFSILALTVGLLTSATTTAQNVLLRENFESVVLDLADGSVSYNLPTGWTKIDADGD